MITYTEIDKHLTDFAVASANGDLIAEMIAPKVQVTEQSAKYLIYDDGDANETSAEDLRAEGASTAEVSYKYSKDSYYCDDHALKIYTSWESIEKAKLAGIETDPEETAAASLLTRINLNEDKRLADKLTNLTAANLGGYKAYTSANSWVKVTSNVSVADPIKDLRDAIDTLAGTRGLPDTLVMGRSSFSALVNNTKTIDRFKYVHVIEARHLEDILGVRVLIANARIDGTLAYAGQAYFLTTTPQLGKVNSSLRTFLWTGPTSAQGIVTDGVLIDKWDDNDRKGRAIRASKYYDQKVTNIKSIYRFTGITAA